MPGVKHLLYRIVRRLRDPDQPLSRNRHFATFDAPEGRRALHIHRQLRSLEDDILSQGDPGRLRVIAPEGATRVRIEVGLPRTRASRTAFLTREELDLLLESPRVGELVRRAAWES